MNQHRPVTAGYDEDFYAWTQDQAERLRKLEALGRKLPVSIDLAHVAEEIEDLGKSDLRGASSLIRNIMVHLIKIASEPRSEATSHWLEEAFTLHADLPGFYTPSMHRLVDIGQLWKRALVLADLALRKHDGEIGRGIPAECPFSLEYFLAEQLDVATARARLGSTAIGTSIRDLPP